MLILGFRGLIGSLTNDVTEQRRLTGTGIFAFLGHDFEQIFKQIVHMRLKETYRYKFGNVKARLRVVPHFSSGIVEGAKRERA